MDEKNRELLTEVIEDRLNCALTHDTGSDESKVAFKEAMEAVDRQIELSKLDATSKEQAEEKLVKEKNAKWDRWIRCGEIALAMLAVPVMEHMFKRRYMKEVCTFEKDYTFTTSAGKGLSSVFRFKK